MKKITLHVHIARISCGTASAIHFLFFRDENVSKHLAQKSHCKTLSREDCKILLNLDHLYFMCYCWIVLYSLLLQMIFS